MINQMRTNRWLTAGFVPPTIYIEFPLFVLRKSCSGQLSLRMFWRAREAIVLCANKLVGLPLRRARPSQPSRRASPEPTRPRFFWVPGHVLHEKEFIETNRRPSTGQQPETKSASRSADKPLTNLPCDPTRLARCTSGFWTDIFFYSNSVI